MKCQHVCENLSAHLDGELSKKDAKEIAEHILVCHHCRAQWEELQTTSALLRDMPEVVPPPEFMTGLRKRLDSMPASVADNDDNKEFFAKVGSVAKAPWYKVVAAAAVFSMAIGITTLWNGGNVNFINSTEIPKTKHQVEKSQSPLALINGEDAEDRSASNENPDVGDNSAVNDGPKTDHDTQSTNQNGDVSNNEPTAPARATGSPESVNNRPAPANVGVSSVDINVSSLVASSSSMKIVVDDVEIANQRIATIARRYNGSVTGRTITIPVGNYSPVLAELASLGGVISDVPSEKDLTGDYRKAIDELKKKQERESEILNEFRGGYGDAGLEQELKTVQTDIRSLDNKVQSLVKNANNIQIKVELVSSDQ